MNRHSTFTGSFILLPLLVFGSGGIARGDPGDNDWDRLWQLPMPQPTTVEVNELGELGKDLEHKKWQMIATRYHQIHFQPSTSKRKLAEIFARIDNLYDFLAERSPEKPPTPVKVFLVPGETGHSRCCRITTAMRTGDAGDAFFMLASLLHEETHLFNFAFLDKVPQGWWAGEFTCQYFQQRALWLGWAKDVRKEIKARMPGGPGCHLAEIGARGRQAFNEAISVLFFLEEQVGREKSIALRKALLVESQKTDGKSLSNSVFQEIFGKPIEQLEAEWRRFYGWE
jgi:hypothetical protein